MDLTDQLVVTPQRENAGSRTQQRFDFQTCWGVSHLLELHQSGQSYAIAFEFHDDVVVIDNATNPTKVRFFQVKGKATGNWTLSALTKQIKGKEGAKPSIIGKLHENGKKFGDATDYLGFVSNQPVSFLEAEKLVCNFKEASKEDFQKFAQALQKECGAQSAKHAELFHHHKTEFGVSGYERYLKGAVIEFINKECGEGTDGNYEGFYRSVIDQCRRRAKHLEEVTSFEDLKKTKFISNQDVDKWVASYKEHAIKRPSWEAILQDIETLAPARKKALKEQWDKYHVDCFKVADTAFSRLKEKVRTTIELVKDDESPLLDIVEKVLSLIKPFAAHLKLDLPDDYFRAAFLYEYYA